MKRTLFLIVSFTFLVFSNLLAQDSKIKLYGEYYQDQVYLAWIPEIWPEEMTGVAIKRLGADGAWQLVTKEVVIPGSYVEKDLSNVEPNSAERQRLKQKLDSLIQNGKGREVSSQKYKEEILPKGSLRTSISMIFALDYDLLILNGFGAVDRNPAAASLQYRLFPVIGAEISANFVEELNIPRVRKAQDSLEMKPHAEVIGKNSSLRLHWLFDRASFLEKEIKGFNIYEIADGQRRKVSDKVIWITSKSDPADLNHVVEFPKKVTSFSAVPVSYFDIEQESSTLEFDPEPYSISIPSPTLRTELRDNDLRLSWDLSHDYDSLLERILIQLKSEESDFSTIAEVLPNTREYDYTLGVSQENLNIRIVLETKQGQDLLSNERFIKYIPKSRIIAPSNLQGKVLSVDDTWYIELKWEYSQDTTDIVFRVFTDGPNNDLIYSYSFAQPITSPYLIPIKSSLSKVQHFSVQAMGAARTKSALSNTVEVITPSKRLPPIRILSANQVENGVQLDWHFSKEVLDLKGFRVEVVGNQLISETELSADLRSYLIEGLEAGTHQIRIRPITIYGIEGEYSSVFKVDVQ